MKHFARKALPLLLCGTLVLGTGAALATGGRSDPLVTLSYLTETVVPELLEKLSKENKDTAKELKSDLADQIEEYQEEMEELLEVGASGSDTYTLVTLSEGQTMELEVGCEVLLRVGSVKVSAPNAPALIDVTIGKDVSAGSGLEKNHLYMSTIEDRTLTPTSETVKVMVRGGYTVD